MGNHSVYKHTSPNGKVYIGITSRNPVVRWANGHGYSGQPKFHNAILKYGWDNFSHEILFSHLSKEEACEIEMRLIEQCDSIRNGYNSSTGGEDPHAGVCKYRTGETFDCFEVIGRTDRKIILKCLNCGTIIERYTASIQKNCVKCKCMVKYNPTPKKRNFCIITHNGKTQSIQEWSKELNIPEPTIRARFKRGQPIDVLRKEPLQECSCETCGKIFIPNYKKQKYCSRECQWDSMKIERPTAVCIFCGKPFTTKRKKNDNYKGMFCSVRCRLASQKSS